MDGYIRISQVAGREGERFHSPDEQREAIEGWAKLHGVRVGVIHTDLDRSGSTMDRPGMNEAIRRVRSGQSGGVIVARIDRFARSVIGGLTTIEELAEHDARIVSVNEGVDPATPIGEAMLGLLLIMARWQWRQADEALELAQARATSAGRFPGRPAYGYGRDERGLTFVDSRTAAVVQRIHEERAAGRGWRSIADGLTRDRVPTPHHGKERWAASTVYGIVRSEAHLGVFIGPRGLRVEDAWPAIVTGELWRRANAVRGVRDDSRRHADRLFAGVARCAGCRGVMSRQVNPHGFVSYGCPTRHCRGGGSIGAGLLDAHVSVMVNTRLAEVKLRPRHAGTDDEARRLVAARDASREEFEAWRDDLEARAAIGDSDYRAGLLARAKARDDAEVALAQHRAAGGLDELAQLPGQTDLVLENLPWAARRRVVETLLHSVWVRRSEVRGPGARRHVDRRVRVVWHDDPAPPTLPSASGPVLPPVTW